MNDNRDQISYSYSDHYSKSRPNFSGENGSGGPFFMELKKDKQGRDKTIKKVKKVV